jgi:hypothetical protein
MIQTTQTLGIGVGRRRTRGPTAGIRVEISILKKLKVAAAFANISIMEYACRVLDVQADRDIDAAINELRNPTSSQEESRHRTKKSS